MRVTIQRTKCGRTHFAVALAVAGNVTAWTEAKEKAGAFTAGEAKKCAGFYENSENVGALTFLDGEKVLHTVEPGGIDGFDETLAATDAEHFQKQAEILGEENEKLRFENDKLLSLLKQQTEYADAAVAVDDARRKEIADLTVKNKELEAILADAE